MQFPEETGRYVFRALAFKTIMSDPGKYGYNLDKGQLYPEFDYKEVTVNTPIENGLHLRQNTGQTSSFSRCITNGYVQITLQTRTGTHLL